MAEFQCYLCKRRPLKTEMSYLQHMKDAHGMGLEDCLALGQKVLYNEHTYPKGHPYSQEDEVETNLVQVQWKDPHGMGLEDCLDLSSHKEEGPYPEEEKRETFVFHPSPESTPEDEQGFEEKKEEEKPVHRGWFSWW